MDILKIEGFSGTTVNFQPTRYRGGVISVGGLTFEDGEIIAPTNGVIILPYTCTMWINTGGDIRVIPASSPPNANSSVLFKGVEGDFHRVIRGIVIADTTVTEVVLDYMEPIK